MEVLGYSFPIEVPSPSGSDDSGIGLSPNPPPCDLRACGPYASESPQESHFVSKSFYSGECTEGGAFNGWAYNQQGPDINASYLNDCADTKHLPIRNKDNFSQEIDNFLESIVVQEKNITNKTNRKNAPLQKRLSNVDINTKQILKLERCLQPKTGNGKPRQTSSKRKMNQTRKTGGSRPAVYPGVRPKTVREVLQHMRQTGKSPRSQSRVQQQRPMQFPTQNQPILPHVPQQMQNIPFPPHQSMSPEYMDQFRLAASPPMRSNLGYPSPASNFSETPPPSYISESSNPQELVGDFCGDNFDNMSIQPNMSPFDQNQMCSSEVFTCAESRYNIQSMSPATTVAAAGSPYQNPTNYPDSPYAIQQPNFAAPDEFNDMQAFVTSQNFVPTQENFPSYSCMSGSQTYETPAIPIMSPYTPVTGAESDENRSFIHQLVINGNMEEISMRLSRFPHAVVAEQIINSKDDEGMTPLLYAVKTNNIEAVSELMKWGADASIPANDGQNALHFAAELPPNMMSFLAAKVPQFGELTKGTATLKAGRTPLHIATEQKNVMNMVQLMSQGALLMAKEQHGGWSALHMAVKNADVKATQEILSFAAYGLPSNQSEARNKPRDIDALREVVCQPAYNENTALHFAAELQVSTSPMLADAQSLIINLLMDNEADPSIKNHQNQLPINLLSSANSQLFERLRGGRRFGHGSRSAMNSSKGDMNLPPLRPVVSSGTGVRFGGPSSGVARTTFLE